MSLPKVTPHQNGKNPPASPKSGEAVVFVNQPTAEGGPSHSGIPDGQDPLQAPISVQQPQPRTEFPTDKPSPSMRTFIYNCTNHSFAGATLFRWIAILLSALLVTTLFAAPAYWIASLVIWFGLILGLIFWRRRLAQEDFVRFDAMNAPAVNPAELGPTAKIPVHVTGLFAVEEREARFTWVAGFYRSFPTREHALLCQVQESRFLGIAKSDEEVAGMWYVFFQPSEIKELRWGHLFFGASPRPTIAVTRRIERKSKGRLGRNKSVSEVLYISFHDEAQGQRIWADLHADIGHPS